MRATLQGSVPNRFADDLDAVADRMHAAKLASDSDQRRTGEIIRLPRTASD